MSVVQNIVFLVNGYPLQSAITSFTFSGENEELDATTVDNSGYREYVAGFKTGNLNVSGIFDADNTDQDRIHDVFSSAYSTGDAKNVLASTGTVSSGSPAIMLDGSIMNYAIPHEVASLILSNANFRANTGIKFGRWLMYAAQAAGTNNGTSLDNSAASTNGGFLQVHLHNDDASDVDVKLQHSTNNTDWVDVSGGAVNNLSAAHTSGSVSVTGTINRYLRVVATVTGGDTFRVSAAFARG